MKKILSIALILCGASLMFSYAAEKNAANKPKKPKIYGFERFYIASLPNNTKPNIQRTPLYNQAMSLYYDKHNYEQEELTITQNNKRVKKNAAFPNIEKARKTFLESYTKEGNKAALFIAAYLHKNYGDTYSIKGQLEYYHIVTALAKDGNCFGYIESSKYFLEGIADITPNFKSAENILKIAESKCSQGIYASNIKKELILLKNGFYADKIKRKENEQ